MAVDGQGLRTLDREAEALPGRMETLVGDVSDEAAVKGSSARPRSGAYPAMRNRSAALLAGIPPGRSSEPRDVWLALRFILERGFFTGRGIEVDGGAQV